MFAGACGLPEKPSLALVPRSYVLHVIVKLLILVPVSLRTQGIVGVFLLFSPHVMCNFMYYECLLYKTRRGTNCEHRISGAIVRVSDWRGTLKVLD